MNLVYQPSSLGSSLAHVTGKPSELEIRRSQVDSGLGALGLIRISPRQEKITRNGLKEQSVLVGSCALLRIQDLYDNYDLIALSKK